MTHFNVMHFLSDNNNNNKKNECHSNIIVDRLQGCNHSKKLRESESESRSSKVVWQARCQLKERSSSSVFRRRRKMSSDSEDWWLRCDYGWAFLEHCTRLAGFRYCSWCHVQLIHVTAGITHLGCWAMPPLFQWYTDKTQLMKTTFQTQAICWSNRWTWDGRESWVTATSLGRPCESRGRLRWMFRQLSVCGQRHSCTCIPAVNIHHASP